MSKKNTRYNSILNQYYIRLIHFFIIFILLTGSNIAQSTYLHLQNPIESACGSASTTLFSKLQNPAQLNNTIRKSFTGGISPSKFDLPELNQALIYFETPIDTTISMSAAVSSFGWQLFNIISASTGVSYSFNEMLSAGASIEYNRISITRFGSDDYWAISVGALLHLTDKVKFGFALQNINRASFAGSQSAIPQKGLFGAGLAISKDFSLDIDCIVAMNQSSGIALAGKYSYGDLLEFRLAALTNPAIIEASSVIHVNSWLAVNLTAQYYSLLGFSKQPAVTLYF
ncbi:MAG: Helix-hairpin-helix DNA-binding class 1 [Ignavibacteria bacterium]|nr:Helix-hairpin-helix DNA-binding class 1 [Ignavibacteria bacterium]